LSRSKTAATASTVAKATPTPSNTVAMKDPSCA
jgi:hypothetical protein